MFNIGGWRRRVCSILEGGGGEYDVGGRGGGGLSSHSTH